MSLYPGPARYCAWCKECMSLRARINGRPAGTDVTQDLYDLWTLHLMAKHPRLAAKWWSFPKGMPEADRERLRLRRVSDLSRRLGM